MYRGKGAHTLIQGVAKTSKQGGFMGGALGLLGMGSAMALGYYLSGERNHQTSSA